MFKKVYVEITNICNMNCSFCHGHLRSPRMMNEEEFSFILEKLAGYTEYIYYHLMGEPLMHPLLIKFIEMAKNSGYKSIITTNGTLLSSRSNELISAGIHKFNISLHSFEKGENEELVSYVKNLADFAKKASDGGAIVVFRLWNNGVDGGKNEISLRTLKENISGVWKENARGIKVKDRIFIEFGERFEWPDENAKITGDKFYCYGLKDQFGILSDGTVVPCCLDSEGSITLGNIFEEELNTILNSKRALNMRDGFSCGRASEELCKRCGYAKRFVR